MKTSLDYINELDNPLVRQKIRDLYSKTMRTLSVSDLSLLLSTIKKLVNSSAQYVGKFRSTIFEEYVFNLIKRELRELKVIRQAELSLNSYNCKVDIAVFKNSKLLMVLETKVDLDASRLKMALGELSIVKLYYTDAIYLIVYYDKTISEDLIRIASTIFPILSIYQFITFLQMCKGSGNYYLCLKRIIEHGNKERVIK